MLIYYAFLGNFTIPSYKKKYYAFVVCQKDFPFEGKAISQKTIVNVILDSNLKEYWLFSKSSVLIFNQHF